MSFCGGAEVGQVGQNTPLKQACPTATPPAPYKGGHGGVAKGAVSLRWGKVGQT